jgi:iron complex transport system substrate-binding protein
MTRIDALNAAAFAFALLASTATARWVSQQGAPRPSPAARSTATARTERLPDGSRGLRGADGVLIPLRHYQRIASASLIADRVLIDLCEPERILAFSQHEQASAEAHRYGTKAQLSSRTPLESMLVLAPDLLFVSSLVDPAYVARLREHGIQVFDLGPMRGLETLPANIENIALLIGAPERGGEYASRLARRIKAVGRVRGRRPRPRAIYLSSYGDRLYGGARHTSYHDVIERAGLRDIAGEAGLSDWPELSAEQVLALAPDIIVTKVGMGATLCRHAGLSALSACTGQGRIIELSGPLLDDPGPGMLEATEALARAVFGD